MTDQVGGWSARRSAARLLGGCFVDEVGVGIDGATDGSPLQHVRRRLG